MVELMHSPSHPGAILRDGCLGEESVASAAARLDVNPDELEAVLNEERPVTPALALRLERGGWSAASVLMRVQAAYDLVQERKRQESLAKAATVTAVDNGTGT